MKDNTFKKPVFQQDGLYQGFTKRHEDMRSSNNKKISLVAVPAVLFLLTQNGIFLVVGFVYLMLVFYYDKVQKRKLFAEYTVLEQNRLEQLGVALASRGISEKASYSFGYLHTEENFAPVFICREGNKLFIFDNIFIKHCIYGIENNMLYLFDLNEAVLEISPSVYQVNSLTWYALAECHQDLLRKEGIRLNKFLVIENFIYATILEDMKSGKTKQLLNTTLALTNMKKEAVYKTELSDGSFLYLPQKSENILHLEQDSADK